MFGHGVDFISTVSVNNFPVRLFCSEGLLIHLLKKKGHGDAVFCGVSAFKSSCGILCNK
jgi:hypothetical protein